MRIQGFGRGWGGGGWSNVETRSSEPRNEGGGGIGEGLISKKEGEWGGGPDLFQRGV